MERLCRIPYSIIGREFIAFRLKPGQRTKSRGASILHGCGCHSWWGLLAGKCGATTCFPKRQRITKCEYTATTSEVNYLLNDHLGSLSVTVNENGALKSELRFSAYGEERLNNGGWSDPMIVLPSDSTKLAYLSDADQKIHILEICY